MANSKNTSGEWYSRNLNGGYTSCIKISGQPILPPMMTEKRRGEMRQLRAKAIEVEHRLLRKRNYNMSEDSAGGEALYEGGVDDIHLLNSLAVSLTEPIESASVVQKTNIQIKKDPPCIATLEAELLHDVTLSTDEDDMLKQFDPYAPVKRKNHVSPTHAFSHALSNTEREQVVVQTSVTSEENAASKPSSADSSAALSNSTDLNNYMDVTETSCNVSQMQSDLRVGTGSTTSDTLRPDSDFTCYSGHQSIGSFSKQEAKTTYEDLNNYLDVILNNSSDSSQYNPVLDSNVTSVDANGNKDSELGRSGDELIISPQPPPDLCDDSQRNALNDNRSTTLSRGKPPNSTLLLADKNQNLEKDPYHDTGNFLQECALSPVLHEESISSTYNEKVQLYLKNLMTGHIRICTFPQNNSSPQSFLLKESSETVEPHPAKDSNAKNSTSEPKSNKTEPTNSDVEGPPRLVRSNSYTLDSPSPLLLAHMEAELRKNSSSKPHHEKSRAICKDRARSAVGSTHARKVWDLEKAKAMPNWYNKYSEKSSSTASQSKKENQSQSSSNSVRVTPKKGPLQSLPSSIAGSIEKMESADLKSPKSCAVVAKSGLNSPKLNIAKKAQLPSSSQESSVSASFVASQSHSTVSTMDSNSKQKLTVLLSELQLQHTREMEELLNRQRKEQEAIQLALLQQQNLDLQMKRTDSSNVRKNVLSRASFGSPVKSPEKSNISISSRRTNSSNSSPISKDKLLQMERRNTSPSIYNKNSLDELQNCLVQYNRSSSISLDDVSEKGLVVPHLNLNSEDSVQGNIRIAPEGPDGLSQQVSGVNVPMNKSIMTSDCHRVNSSAGSSEVILHSSDISPLNIPKSVSIVPSCCETTSHSAGALISTVQTNFIIPDQLDKNDLKSSIANVTSASMPQVDLRSTRNIPPNMSTSLPSSFMNNMILPTTDVSAHGKRKAWCSRQLFSEDYNLEGNQSWLLNPWEKQKHLAAAKIQAGVRGYLIRRLLQTERVQNCITTIRDTIVCALQLQRDCTPHVEASDLELHGRLIQQLSAACEDLHGIFFSLTVAKQMAIISADREWLRSRTPLTSSSSSTTRPLSRATQIAMQRKMMQSYSETSSVRSNTSNVSRTRRRSWAVMDSQSRPSSASTNALMSNYETGVGFLSQSSAPAGHILQRSASAGSRRKPWR